MSKKSLSVPQNMQAIYEAIVSLTDNVCRQHLNQEYADMARLATAALCRKRPSPLLSGKPATWACGVVYALGFVNFLFDRSFEPYLSVDELCGAFAVAKSTGANKSKQVRELLAMSQLDSNWTLPGMMDKNPMAWLISVNGVLLDARSAPRELQEIAYKKGLIPYIPGDKKPESAPAAPEASPEKSGKKAPVPQQSLPQSESIHQLKVTLLGAKPPIWRRIQVASTTRLDKLHDILQVTMGWTNSHLHHFVIGKRPDWTFYAPPELNEGDDMGLMDNLNEREYTLKQIAPKEKDKFIYEYDFGDSWEHEILVEKILPRDPKITYPNCMTGKRACPPEDVGGVWGYADFLETINDPGNPEREDMLEWLGDDFDPAYFDADAVNRILKKAR